MTQMRVYEHVPRPQSSIDAYTMSCFLLQIFRFVVGLFGLGLLSAPAFAVLPEVSNVQMQKSGANQTLSWSSLSGTAGYHVYRGTLLGLRTGDFGSCLFGSVQGTAVSVNQEPPVGSGYFFMLSGFDQTGEGSLGSRNPSPRCVAARRYMPATINGDPGDGVPDGMEPRRNPSAAAWTSSREFTGVYLHTGEFFLSTADLRIADRFLPEKAGVDLMSLHGDLLSYYQDRLGNEAYLETANERRAVRGHSTLALMRNYRSLVAYDGPMGHGWDSATNARLRPTGSNVLYFDGTGHQETFLRVDATHFTSPPGQYSVLKQNANGSFTLRSPAGTLIGFHAFDGSNQQGSLASIQDRNGDLVTFLYDNQGLLTTLVDSLGRAITYAYDPQGRVTSITDFAGRQVVYSYDGNGDLVSVRSPVVTGTPNGNDFPSGKTTSYTYSSSFADPRLKHNLLSVISPREFGTGLPILQNSYETNPASFQFDRVIGQTIGGTNSSGIAAGGSITYSYLALNPGGNPANLALPRRKATMLDRNGNQKDFVHNVNGNLLSRIDYTNRNLRPGEPDYTTSRSYNADEEVLEVIWPQGNRSQFTYDRPGADRYREGNVLEVRLKADTVASGGRGNGHGGEANDRVWSYAYEPVFNQVRSRTEPRGNDSSYIPQNGGTWSSARYTTSWFYDYQEGDPATNGIGSVATQFGIVLGSIPFTLGDINGDGSTAQATGSAVKVQDPSVLLASGSNQAVIEGDTSQDIVTLHRYNARGQAVSLTDAEGNRHDFEYYPETDPDGDGGTTPTPPDGRILDTITGGYPKTRTFDTLAASPRDNGTNPPPTMIRHDFSYDPVGNLTNFIDGRGIRTRWVVNALNQVVEMRRAAATADSSGPSGDPSTGRGETGLTAFAFLTRYAYDADDNIQTVQVEDRGATRGIGSFISSTWTFDLLDQPVEVQQQATASLNLITQFRYDANENWTRRIQPAGNAQELAYDERDLRLTMTRGAFGPRGGLPSTRSYFYDPNGNFAQMTDGRGSLVDVQYDGFDRSVHTIDQVGNTTDAFYDPASNRVEALFRGPVGGPTPGDRSGAGNVDLADVHYLYDELSRLFRSDRELFVPSGATPERTPILTEGPLIPADGSVNTIFEYDQLSRRSFVVQDTGFTSRQDYDGVGRLLKLTVPGSNLTEWTYDANNHVVEIVETEAPSLSGPPTEVFLTTFFYDAANRRTTLVDNVGQTSRYLYDSLGAITSATDAKGPLSGSINRRSPGHTGIIVSINSHGNLTRRAYDGAERLISTIRTLTMTGQGDGTLNPSPDTTNPNNPDGLITSTTVWDPNSLVAIRQDDKGRQTQYAWDNLNRLKSIAADDGTLDQFAYDAEDNLTSRTEANGTVVTNSYDLAQRRLATSILPAMNVEGTTQRTFQHDGRSRLTLATDNNIPTDSTDNVTVGLIYDSLGRVIEETQAISDGTPLRSSDHGWQADSLQTDLVYPSGRQIQYAYDALDRLQTVTDTTRSETVSYQYFGLGRVHTRNYGNGIRATRLNESGTVDVGFDGARRTVLLRYLDPGNLIQAGFEYKYDRADNATSHRRLHHAGVSGSFKGEIYAYDSAYQLISFQEGFLSASHLLISSPTDTQSWGLDGAGNWVQMTRNGQVFLATPNNNNEYDEMQSGGTRVDDGVPDDFMDQAATPSPDGFNLIHDKNGNETNIGQFTLRYDFENRPVRAIRNSDSLQVASYTHDALGRRVRRVTTNSTASSPPNETRRYYYARSRVIEERDQADALVRQVVYGLENGGHLWQVRGDGSSQYLLNDRLGSIVALAAGTTPSILERVTFDSYGKPTFESDGNVPLADPFGAFLAQSPNGNPDLLHGMRYDPELGARTNNVNTDLGGLHQTQFRYYDTNKGRFTTRDPVGIWTDEINLGNGYTFAGNNPLNRTDPLGLRNGRPYGPRQPRPDPPGTGGPSNPERPPREVTEHRPILPRGPGGPPPEPPTGATVAAGAELLGLGLSGIGASGTAAYGGGCLLVGGVGLSLCGIVIITYVTWEVSDAFWSWAFSPSTSTDYTPPGKCRYRYQCARPLPPECDPSDQGPWSWEEVHELSCGTQPETMTRGDGAVCWLIGE